MRENTRVAHLGRCKGWSHGIVNTPVYRASTCTFESFADFRRAIADPDSGLFYARLGTPSQWSLREAIRDLENGAGSWLYPSGMTAVAASILSLVEAGDHVLMTDGAYEPGRTLCNDILPRYGIETTFFDPTAAAAALEPLFRDNTRLVAVESPSSMTLEVQDLPAIARLAHDHGARVVVDNTWATPLYCRALELGADVVVHAVTKYIGGHSDLVMGVATANDETWPALQETSVKFGFTTSPDDAWLALRGLRTLPARLARHQAGAMALARWLAEHPEVARVHHPALEGSPGHEFFRRDFRASTGLFAVILARGHYEQMGALVDHLELFKMGFSWGGFESLLVPYDPSQLRSGRRWEAPGPLLRIHVGLEDPEDLIADLRQGLDRFTASLE